jgi:hypothetical protein
LTTWLPSQRSARSEPIGLAAPDWRATASFRWVAGTDLLTRKSHPVLNQGHPNEALRVHAPRVVAEAAERSARRFACGSWPNGPTPTSSRSATARAESGPANGVLETLAWPCPDDPKKTHPAGTGASQPIPGLLATHALRGPSRFSLMRLNSSMTGGDALRAFVVPPRLLRLLRTCCGLSARVSQPHSLERPGVSKCYVGRALCSGHPGERQKGPRVTRS